MFPTGVNFRVDRSEFDELEKHLVGRGGIAEHHFRRMRHLLAEEIVTLITDGFIDSRDPYGTPWEAIKPYMRRRDDGSVVFRSAASQPLLDTGTLRDSWDIDSDDRTTVIGTDVRHAVYHQSTEPRSVLPRRAMIPDDTQGLPSGWRKALEGQSIAYLRRVLE